MNKSILYEEKCKGVNIPTDDEVEALSALKALKLRVREVKKKISEISSTEKKGATQSLRALDQDLVRLKKEWDRWEEKRSKAARERMIMLGHEERG
jgi:hypothetical protein